VGSVRWGSSPDRRVLLVGGDSHRRGCSNQVLGVVIMTVDELIDSLTEQKVNGRGHFSVFVHDGAKHSSITDEIKIVVVERDFIGRQINQVWILEGD
jgi:hypothetical protein